MTVQFITELSRCLFKIIQSPLRLCQSNSVLPGLGPVFLAARALNRRLIGLDKCFRSARVREQSLWEWCWNFRPKEFERTLPAPPRDRNFACCGLTVAPDHEPGGRETRR